MGHHLVLLIISWVLIRLIHHSQLSSVTGDEIRQVRVEVAAEAGPSPSVVWGEDVSTEHGENGWFHHEE